MIRPILRRAGVAAILLAGVLALGACGGRPDIVGASRTGPALALEAYFDGRLTATGVFQDRFEDVRRAFTVEIEGAWDGETLTLVEDFVYEDGAVEQRIWRLRKTGPSTWEGAAEGVVGKALGEVRGSAFNFRYTFDLERPGGDRIRVDFDDWMFRINDRDMVNRAYVSKYGVEIGTLSIFFRREPSPDGS
jgi:hypothetical protein